MQYEIWACSQDLDYRLSAIHIRVSHCVMSVSTRSRHSPTCSSADSAPSRAPVARLAPDTLAPMPRSSNELTCASDGSPSSRPACPPNPPAIPTRADAACDFAALACCASSRTKAFPYIRAFLWITAISLAALCAVTPPPPLDNSTPARRRLGNGSQPVRLATECPRQVSEVAAINVVTVRMASCGCPRHVSLGVVHPDFATPERSRRGSTAAAARPALRHSRRDRPLVDEQLAKKPHQRLTDRSGARRDFAGLVLQAQAGPCS